MTRSLLRGGDLSGVYRFCLGICEIAPGVIGWMTPVFYRKRPFENEVGLSTMFWRAFDKTVRRNGLSMSADQIRKAGPGIASDGPRKSELSKRRQRAIAVWSVICLSLSLGIVISFIFALKSSWYSQNPEDRSCTFSFNGRDMEQFSYVQFDIRDQEPVEPTFRGGLFLNMGNLLGETARRIVVTESAGRGFGPQVVNADLYYDNSAEGLWMRAPVDISYNRVSGSHRDFPFDSSDFDFDISFKPTIPINNVLLRNHNSSFYLPCGRAAISKVGPEQFHIHFALERNRLVMLTSVVLILGGASFLVAIVFFVKSDSLPTAVASYFFSLWSIRAILSSEIKTFPTKLDMAILSLCVLLVALIGVRLSRREIRNLASKKIDN